jgi:hypothetical protein
MMIKVRVDRFAAEQPDPDGPFDMGYLNETRPAGVVFDSEGEEVELIDDDGNCCLAEVRIDDDGKVTAVPVGEWVRGGI